MDSPTPPPWYGPDGILGTADDWTDEQIAAHIAAQEDVPDDQVACIADDGSIYLRPLGGRVDVEDGDDS